MTKPAGRPPLFPRDAVIRMGRDHKGVLYAPDQPPMVGPVRSPRPRARFEHYRDGMTVAEHLDAVGVKYSSADLVMDIRMGYIRLDGGLDLYVKKGTAETYKVANPADPTWTDKKDYERARGPIRLVPA